MRIKLLMLALAVAFTVSTSAQARPAVLGFAASNIQPPAGLVDDPNYPVPPDPASPVNPFVAAGLSDFTQGPRLGTTNGSSLLGSSVGNPLVVDNGAKFILQIQMVDTTVLTFTASNNNNRMGSSAVRLSWSTPNILTSTRDADNGNGRADPMAVNDGGDGPQENITFANNYSVAGASVGLGNLYGPWQNPSPSPKIYVLYNIIMTATSNPAGGDTVLTLTDPSVTSADFTNGAGTSMDAAVFATIPQLFVHVNPVPEPSSMVLAGLVVSGIGYRLRRKKVAEAKV